MTSADVLSQLLCPKCGRPGLRDDTSQHLTCSACQSSYPLENGRFPDFLTLPQRQQLAKEMEFWNQNFAGQIYQDESEKSYADWAERMQAQPSDRVLEVGCGSGALLTRLPAQHRFGLEPVVSLLTATQGFFGVVAVAESMPFRDSSFDLVYFKHSLHHVVDKSAALKEAVRITKAGGRLIVMEPNASHPQRALVSNPSGFFRKYSPLSRLIGPVETFQTMPEVIEMVRGLGCELLESEYTHSHYDRLTFRQFLQKVYALIFGFLPRRFIEPNYFISFRKLKKAKIGE